MRAKGLGWQVALGGVAMLGAWALWRHRAGPASYRGRTVLITGGSRGLGLALAQAFLNEGAHVVLVARKEDELRRATHRLQCAPTSCLRFYRADVTRPEDLSFLFGRVREEFGALDVLVNNAGSIVFAPYEAMAPADFHAQIAVHLQAVEGACRLALPLLRASRAPQIVNISSVGGLVPLPHMTAYCASKHALAGFSSALGLELRREGIAVTTVYPGLMRTGSHVQAVFKGDAEREYAWFAMGGLTPGMSMHADRAAAKILEGVRRRRSELVISLPARAAHWLHFLAPEIYHWLAASAARLLPRDTRPAYSTGAQAAHWLSRRPWSAPQRRLGRRAQAALNQHSQGDAEFNLNLRRAR